MRALVFVCVAFLCGWSGTGAATGQAGRRAGGAVAGTVAGKASTDPIAVIDTSEGRLRCRLFAREKPVTVALFRGYAEGSKDWTDPRSGTVTHGKPLYEGALLYGVSAGMAAGRRLSSPPGAGVENLKPEASASLKFDRPGRLALRVTRGQLDAASFYVLDHAEERSTETAAAIFGQCDEASVQVVAAVSHALLSTDNHPASPMVVNRVTLIAAGEALPPVASALPPASVVDEVGAAAPLEAIASPEPTGPAVLIETAVGTIRCRLFSKEAPVATANFIGLANGTKSYTDPKTRQVVRGRRFYDGLAFGRIIPDFMIQNADLPNDPSGGDTIGFHFGNEIVPGLAFDRPGRLAYANSGPDTNESEFFITEHPIARLTGSYTIFGQCDAPSVRIVETIARLPRDAQDHALKPVVIRKVTIQ